MNPENYKITRSRDVTFFEEFENRGQKEDNKTDTKENEKEVMETITYLQPDDKTIDEAESRADDGIDNETDNAADDRTDEEDEVAKEATSDTSDKLRDIYRRSRLRVRTRT